MHDSDSVPATLVDAYLDEALALSVTETDRIHRAMERLPDVVADAHSHIAGKDHFNYMPDYLRSHAVSTFPWYSVDDAARVRATLWPGARVWSLRMPHATTGYNHRAVNEHLLGIAPGAGDAIGGYGLPDDVDYTIGLLGLDVAALKMYYKYREPAAQSLGEVFPDPVLDAAARAGVPVIVHLPQSLPDGLEDLLATALRFPSLQFVIAHAGGGGGHAFCEDVRSAFKALAGLPAVFFDTALVWDQRLLSTLLAICGPERVLFGTDEPLSLIRAVPYEHPRLGLRLYAPRYHWATDDVVPLEVVDGQPQLLHLLQVEAVLEAVEPYGAGAVNAVFHDNAARLFRRRTV